LKDVFYFAESHNESIIFIIALTSVFSLVGWSTTSRSDGFKAQMCVRRSRRWGTINLVLRRPMT